jgi:hypothetical protein
VQSPDTSNSAVLATPKERLAYIADMLEQLERMAADCGHGTLAGILQVASEEAKHAATLEN